MKIQLFGNSEQLPAERDIPDGILRSVVRHDTYRYNLDIALAVGDYANPKKQQERTRS